MASRRKSKDASLIGASSSENKRRPYGNYVCTRIVFGSMECARPHVQDSADPMINRWCSNCQQITKQKFISNSTPVTVNS